MDVPRTTRSTPPRSSGALLSPVHVQAMEGMLVSPVVAERRFPCQTSTAVDHREAASLHRKAVDQREGQLADQVVRGPTAAPQRSTACLALRAKVVRVHRPPGQDYSACQHVRVRKSRRGPALIDASLVIQLIALEAEDGHDEGAKLHGRRPPLRSLADWSTIKRRGSWP